MRGRSHKHNHANQSRTVFGGRIVIFLVLNNVHVCLGVPEAHEQIQVKIIKQSMQRLFYYVYTEQNQLISDTSCYRNSRWKGNLNATHIVASRITDISLTGQRHIGVQQFGILTHLPSIISHHDIHILSIAAQL